MRINYTLVLRACSSWKHSICLLFLLRLITNNVLVYVFCYILPHCTNVRITDSTSIDIAQRVFVDATLFRLIRAKADQIDAINTVIITFSIRNIDSIIGHIPRIISFYILP